MKSKFVKALTLFIAISLLVFTFTSCSEPEDNSNVRRNLTINLANDLLRTIRPEALTTPGFYEIVITSTTNPETTYSANSTTTSISIENVLIGDYTVEAKAYKDETKAVLLSEGTGNISVKPSGENTTLIKLKAITSGNHTGSVSVTFDWTELINSNNELFNDVLSKYDIKITLTDLDTQKTYENKVSKGSSSYTFTQDGIPVSTGFRGQFTITYQKEELGAEYLLAQLETEEIQVFSGETSVKTYKLTQNNVIDYSTAPQITLKYGANPESEILVTWPHQYPNKKDRFQSVTLTISDGDLFSESYTTQSSSENTYTFTGLTAGTTYTISASAITSEGIETAKISATYQPKVFVTSVNIDEANILDAIAVGTEITLNGSIGPENATIKGATWSITDPSILEIVGTPETTLPSSVTFRALKPGKTTITLTAKDKSIGGEVVSKTTTKEIQVKLPQPDAPKAVANSTSAPYSINVTWTLPENSDSAILYRKDNADANWTKVEEFQATTTSYIDEKGIQSNNSYTYAIEAKSTVGTWATSVKSAKSNAINPSAPAISLENATLTPNLDIEFATDAFNLAKGFYITPEKGATLTINNKAALEGAKNFQWEINGIKQGVATQEISDLSITYETEGINQNPQMVNSATLTCEKDGLKYSGSVYFRAITTPDVDITLTINGQSEATFTDCDKHQTLLASTNPENADLKTIHFSSSNPEVASVDRNGVITFHPGKIGDVTITATPMYGTPASVTLHVIQNSINLIKEIFPYMQEQFATANTEVKGDWAGITQSTGVTVTKDKLQNDSYLTLDSLFHWLDNVPAGYNDLGTVDFYWKFSVSSQNYKTLSISTTEPIKTIVTNGGGSGALGTDPVRLLGQNGQGKIKIDIDGANYYLELQLVDIDVRSGKTSGSIKLTSFSLDGKQIYSEPDINYSDSRVPSLDV